MLPCPCLQLVCVRHTLELFVATSDTVSLTVKVINKEPISGPRGRGQGSFLSTGGSAGPGCFVQPVLDRWLLHNSFAYCERAAVPGGRARRSAAAPDRRGCCPHSRPSPGLLVLPSPPGEDTGWAPAWTATARVSPPSFLFFSPFLLHF